VSNFGFIDWLVIIVYLCGTGVLFSYFARKKKNVQDFLLAGRKMGWFPLALSILASGVSAISMLGTPTYIFRENLQMAVPALLLTVPLTIFIGLTMIPALYLLKSYTIYEYLEMRFHRYIRTAVSIMQILTKLSWVATIIYVPSLIISTVSSMPSWVCILLVGLVAIIYTTFGGYESIVWADVIHFCAIMVGLIAVCVVLLMEFDGSIVKLWDNAEAAGNTQMFNFTPDLKAEATIWAVMTSMIISTLGMFGTDQMIIQKCYAAKNLRSAVWSMVGNSIIGIPFSLLLILLGLGLAAFFHADPDAYGRLLTTDPDPAKALDKAIPYFITYKVPVGIGGLFVAAVLAVTISSVNSGITTLATITLKDLIEKLFVKSWRNDDSSMAASRWLTLSFGIIATVIALWVGRIGTIIKIFAILYSFIGSPLFGVFMLGLFTRTANNFGVVCGLIAGYIICPLCYFVWEVNWVWLGSMVTFTVISVGFLSSCIYRRIANDYVYSEYTWKYKGDAGKM
jgi:SSS family transporter